MQLFTIFNYFIFETRLKQIKCFSYRGEVKILPFTFFEKHVYLNKNVFLNSTRI